ncbi:hypothetical protein SKAU_G00178590 [Synaphobranchus kaupii]|uniref:Uncharacterized protein n=1 Tax=Synaphobranchus kaupii TaxID=118154 RepID=A0A9Q1IZA6_SYNKA|nr:hypothetical protein SKAU_G00178590 [Synaphobranchus kaupii]
MFRRWECSGAGQLSERFVSAGWPGVLQSTSSRGSSEPGERHCGSSLVLPSRVRADACGAHAACQPPVSAPRSRASVPPLTGVRRRGVSYRVVHEGKNDAFYPPAVTR